MVMMMMMRSALKQGSEFIGFKLLPRTMCTVLENYMMTAKSEERTFHRDIIPYLSVRRVFGVKQ